MHHEFKIPTIPPSVNSVYRIIWHLKRFELHPDIRKFKSDVGYFIRPIDTENENLFSFSFEYHANWYTKNGRIKRHDGMNCDKVLYDAVMEKLGIDDSRVWKWDGKKVQNDNEKFTIVRIGIMESDECGS